MTKGLRWRSHKRYVERWEKAQEEDRRRAICEMPLEPTVAEQAMSRPCMSDFEAYGAICPPGAACATTGVCARWARRQALIVACRGASLTARSGL